MLNDIYESTSKWLKAADIKGHKPIVTIVKAEVRENDFDGEKKKQIVLTFEGKDKELGLNFTNAAKLAELTGSENYDDWVGVAIKLHVERVKFQNGLVDAIRIFPELPEQANGKKAKAATDEPPTFPNGTPTDEDDPDSIPF